MNELTRLRVFELTKSALDAYPVSVDFSDVISAYDKAGSITAVEVQVDPAVCPSSNKSLIEGSIVDPGNAQKVILGIGCGDPGYTYHVSVQVTTSIPMPDSSTVFAKFGAMLLITVRSV